MKFWNIVFTNLFFLPLGYMTSATLRSLDIQPDTWQFWVAVLSIYILSLIYFIYRDKMIREVK